MNFFCFFSIIFLRKKLKVLQWAGIITVVVGLVVVGLSDLLFDTKPEGNHTGGEKSLGIILILSGMIFTSLQVCKKRKRKYYTHYYVSGSI
jgi:drug/metabolite transporter (DMT)-like permease